MLDLVVRLVEVVKKVEVVREVEMVREIVEEGSTIGWLAEDGRKAISLVSSVRLDL